MKHISSIQNSEVKKLLLLQAKAKVRKEEKLFVVEGRRELKLAQQAGYHIEKVFWCPELFDESAFSMWQQNISPTQGFVSVDQQVYKKMVVRESTEGVVGVLHQKKESLEQYVPKKDALILVLESIEKPGNLGAILRTSEAAAVDAVLVTEQHTEIHNPNVIRSSVGGFFATSVFVCSNKEANAFLQHHNISTYAAVLQKSIPYTEANFSGATAVIMGSEATGLSEFWTQRQITPIKIPMLGHVDSLNVSVATAVILYEIQRQRNR